MCLIFNLIKWPLDFPSSYHEISVGEKEAPVTANTLLVGGGRIFLGFRNFYLPLLGFIYISAQGFKIWIGLCSKKMMNCFIKKYKVSIACAIQEEEEIKASFFFFFSPPLFFFFTKA